MRDPRCQRILFTFVLFPETGKVSVLDGPVPSKCTCFRHTLFGGFAAQPFKKCNGSLFKLSGGRGVTVGGVESSARPRPVGHGDADPGGGVADQAGEGDTAGGPGPG